MSTVQASGSRVFVDVPSEDVTGKKLDIALRDTAIKAGSGATVGAVFSLLYKRRRWPILFGFAFGLGMGFSNLQHSLKAPLPRLYVNSETAE